MTAEQAGKHAGAARESTTGDATRDRAKLGTDVLDSVVEAARLLAAPARGEDPLGTVAAALQVSRLADAALRVAVDQARTAGRTWQQIGDILGTTRQAVFQRFGHPIDPRTGVEMPKETLPGAAERAVELFAELSQGHWEEIRTDFDTTMTEKLTAEGTADGWAQVVGMVGAFERIGGEPFVRRQADCTVVDVPLEFEAGPMKGRVSFDAERKIAGLFILNPDTP